MTHDTLPQDPGKGRLRTALLLLLAAAAGFGLAWLLLLDPLGLRHAPVDDGVQAEAAGEDETLWTCGMHPHILVDEPGQCPICKMDLVPLRPSGAGGQAASAEMEEVWTCPDHPMIHESEAGECPIDGKPLVRAEFPGQAGSAAGPEVRIDPAVVQTMNVRTAEVERRDLSRRLRTVGYLEFDQQRMVTVTTKYSGWVEEVFVNYLGEAVRKGQPLFEVYSPELVQTQQELLSAQRFAQRMATAPPDSRRRAEALLDAARQRLSYWDISSQQVEALESRGEVQRTLTVTAPAAGVVMKRMPGLEGMAVTPGLETYHIANLSTLWLSVEVFEDQMAWIRPGTPAEVSFTYFPGETFHGTVRLLEPELSEQTRTLRARLLLPNPDGRLRPGMFATVELHSEEAADALAVPASAVLRTGRRSVVMVQTGEGRFEPREVVPGLEDGGFVQVLEGLEEGETVVTSAQFLLDSESRLQEAIRKMAGDS